MGRRFFTVCSFYVCVCVCVCVCISYCNQQPLLLGDRKGVLNLFDEMSHFLLGLKLKMDPTLCSSKSTLYIFHNTAKFPSKKCKRDFPGVAVVKNLPADAGAWVRALVREDPTCLGATMPMWDLPGPGLEPTQPKIN